MSQPETWQERLFTRYYFGKPGWRNGTWQFQDRCREFLAGRPQPLILELGCGPTNDNTRFLAGLGTVDGADIDPEAAGNSHIRQFRLLKDSTLDYPDGAFDACVSFWTAEHVEDPARHLQMIHRALKPGGYYLFMTPNLLHYVSLVAHLTPHSFHVRVANRLRKRPESAHDPYPTFFRMNTAPRIRRLAAGTGFEPALIEQIEIEPNYGRASRLLFYPFLAYERIVSRWDFLASLRHTLIVALRKPD